MDTSKHNFENIRDNQIRRGMNAVQANELEMVGGRHQNGNYWSGQCHHSLCYMLSSVPLTHASP